MDVDGKCGMRKLFEMKLLVLLCSFADYLPKCAVIDLYMKLRWNLMPACGVFKSELELSSSIFSTNPYSTTKMTDTLHSIAITLKLKNLRSGTPTAPQTPLSQSFPTLSIHPAHHPAAITEPPPIPPENPNPWSATNVTKWDTSAELAPPAVLIKPRSFDHRKGVMLWFSHMDYSIFPLSPIPDASHLPDAL